MKYVALIDVAYDLVHFHFESNLDIHQREALEDDMWKKYEAVNGKGSSNGKVCWIIEEDNN